MTDPHKAKRNVLNALYPVLGSLVDEGTYVESAQAPSPWPDIYQIFKHDGVELCVEVRVSIVEQRDTEQSSSTKFKYYDVNNVTAVGNYSQPFDSFPTSEQ
jgi:hypothetical protein